MPKYFDEKPPDTSHQRPCTGVRVDLKSCLLETDCCKLEKRTPRDCLKSHDPSVPHRCYELAQLLFECKRSLIYDAKIMSKLKGPRLLSEVEKYRNEHNWRRLIELVPLVKQKGSSLEHLGHILLGESQLESFIEESSCFPHPDRNNYNALKDAKKNLKEALNDANNCEEKQKHQIELEAKLLLAKLRYICANYEAALDLIQHAGLERVSVDFPSLRTLRIVAEAYAIKGLCLDHIPPKSTSKYNKEAREEQILSALLQSAELAVLYLMEVDKNAAAIPVMTTAQSSINLAVPQTHLTTSGTQSKQSSSQDRLGELLEVAIQRVPIMRMKRSKAEGIETYRHFLRSVDKKQSQYVHETLARQLAEVLIRGTSDSTFPKLNFDAFVRLDGQKTAPVSFNLDSSANSKKTVFTPENRLEEILLLLLVCDGFVCREAVLSRAEAHADARTDSLHNAKAVHNLLVLVLSNLRQYQYLVDVLERAMKFAFDDTYLWLQFSLALLCQARFNRAALVLHECEKMQSKDPIVHMLIAKLYIEHLGRYEEGIEQAKLAMQLTHGGWLAGRASLIQGIGHSLIAYTMPTYAERKWEESKAVDCFIKATRIDSNDFMGWFLLALQYSINRDIKDAMDYCEHAYSLGPDNPTVILLMALLLTAEQRHVEALELVENTLDDYPNHFALLVLLMKLELKLNRISDALTTAKDLLMFWQRQSFVVPEHIQPIEIIPALIDSSSLKANAFSDDMKSSSGVGTLHPSPSVSILPTHASMMDIDRQSITAASAMGPLSEHGAAASTLSDSFGFTGVSAIQRSVYAAFRIQANVWLELGEMFLESGKIDEVLMCVNEALTLFPASHHAVYLKGRLRHTQGSFQEAKGCYLAALSLYPHHFPSLRQLALCYKEEGNLQMAEKLLRDLVRLDPLDHESWNVLAQILGLDGQSKASSECYATALSLEESAPILPFTVIPRVLNM